MLQSFFINNSWWLYLKIILEHPNFNQCFQ